MLKYYIQYEKYIKNLKCYEKMFLFTLRTNHLTRRGREGVMVFLFVQKYISLEVKTKKSKQDNDETREAGILISALMTETDLLCQINFEDLIKDFVNKKCRKKLFFFFQILTKLALVERNNF